MAKQVKKSKGLVGLVMGFGMVLFASYSFLMGGYFAAVIQLLIGAGLISLKVFRNRYGNIIFGHLLIVVGAILTTMGIYYVPGIYKQLEASAGHMTMGMIFGMPLFWGIFTIFGGVCAIYHGFCKCVRGEWSCGGQ